MEQENGASSSEDIQEKVEKVRKISTFDTKMITKWSSSTRFYFIESSAIFGMYTVYKYVH